MFKTHMLKIHVARARKESNLERKVRASVILLRLTSELRHNRFTFVHPLRKVRAMGAKGWVRVLY